ncbi:sugar transferase [Actomonas aquatica]|uniref:Sugar transferase n=1 Tax=Actomonas aquatica TaxID=2866162 RepID=A0ABZ1CAL1_9BACT|nr:sugar transferase [Opitutus sp. WL0086]WRQ88581.1 sugar transferase [Opitutus sp. WL0086]
MAHKRSYPRTQNLLLLTLFLGDLAFAYFGLTLGYLLRVKSPLRTLGIEPSSVSFELYQPLIWLGTIFILLVMGYQGLYDARLLLRPHRALSNIMRGIFFWVVAFLGFSLVFRMEPAISRYFVLISSVTTFAVLVGWRFTLYYALSNSEIRRRLTQRVVIIGWSAEAERLVEAIDRDSNHPYEVVGVIAVDEKTANNPRQLLGERLLGEIDQLESLLQHHEVDIAVLADLDLPKHRVVGLMALCERLYVSLKIVPSFFQVFVSNLRMQTISGVPILGVEELPIAKFYNQLIKRSVDLIGGIVGLLGSLPVILVLTLIIRRESPGPVIYRQTRTGLHGRPFTIYKLRSMRLDAEKDGAQWAQAGDPRRLRIGAFMREWNLDELPQFWNVLKGDMSLVGPRPERPELIKQFEREIPHYNPRHEVRPGVTGWAQVNGLRGNTSLVDRIRYDLYYIENWSIWFDVQIMLLTFFKRDNAY